ncbi:MAG: hypothetical protein IPJ20_20870 [Flammeovirgaceae bacterium]|nr:hypothetical protein [Flammeovirgaceae bacterium]
MLENLRIGSTLNTIDNIFCKEWQLEGNGLLAGRGGCSLYLMYRHFQIGKAILLDISLEILEKEVSEVNKNGLQDYLSIGNPTSSSSWLIDQFIKLDILDDSEKLNSNEWIQFLIKSTASIEFDTNRHDLFYGFIGKSILIIEHDQHLAQPFVTRIIAALKKSATNEYNGIHWKSPYPFHATTSFEQTINFGIPHGSCGIMLFLLKCYDLFDTLKYEIEPLVKGNFDWLIDRLNKADNKLLYSYSNTPSGTGKLGWCYGDQAIAYTLLRYYETFNAEEAKVKAYELIEQAASKSMVQSGVKYYPHYGYYDVRVCHGTSSVAYMWLKMYQITKDIDIKALADKWLSITLDNLDVFLPQLDKIAELEKDNDMIDTSMGFLNGLSGVGLVLLSFLDPKLNSWDKLLLLDRPGRE